MTVWKGVFPAVTTKMREDGTVDLKATQASIGRLIDSGVSGVIVLPMLGENASLRPEERESVIRAAAEVVAGRVPLLSGLAEISLDAATASARAYERFGAEGLMVFPSLGYKTDPRETAAWYKAIAASMALPIMIYNNPIAYGVDVTPAILKELADTPSIICIKEETGDIRRVTDMYVELGNRFQIFCGVDDLIVESMVLGVTGWVSGMTNAWPRECVAIFNLCAQGRFAEALGLYRLMTPAFHLDTHVKLVQYIKFAEHLVYGAPEWTRAPRLPLVGEERTQVSAVITRTIADLQAYARRAA
ncbi:dihydrodipicolinate synthase family protein [Bradyrhizobium sp. U87765 SZCCT0131]|uniref:dihydrodipicolinate synthase family protein n=1 Tax=unclassified Bradyrhizobium TaxID=2631580 RepID=UPI001BAC4896|nr:MULTISPECIES: dihydrodipicolinate synthase family protein [unclassified Bradyrhizobium]MBR1217193.1 dihydrodipicolinate synthase family protein [Bradyrhizobium sp. U87765 SZCCT0131]MBR1259051.1 dihydrodipicolinate synthase family protein [Bradyrhizobium sp. U87765 SZCCT0134]MBR1305192.1 dihydrodipicolinate synthase family protein [Bradyrhizobium sp. U87765 SZCCT0110]MBR1320978.1 dihydrodipicolinate synthase family protein [Bradyrhizobium sp. U87765 SZCCT0109]MBR1350368.1 dihydrodipicolinate